MFSATPLSFFPPLLSSMAESLFLPSPTLHLSLSFSLSTNGGRKPKSLFLLPSSSSSSPPRLRLSCSPSRTNLKTHRKPPPVFSEGRDGDDLRPLCPGCGVFLQRSDPNLPGFFLPPRPRPQRHEIPPNSASKSDLDSEFPVFSDPEVSSDDGEGVMDWDSDWDSEEDEITSESVSKSNLSDPKAFSGIDDGDGELDWETEDEQDEKLREELDGFTPPGVGYGNVTEETLRRFEKEKVSKAEKKRRAREALRSRAGAEDIVTVCARCHALRHYGQVKNHTAENLIPDFDFDRLVSSRLTKPSAGAPLVVMVVDCADFDGSFPKRAVKSLFKVLEGRKRELKPDKSVKLVLVATKVDLLPSQISPARLERWVRGRAKLAGAPKLSAVYLVSARKDLGVRNLLAFIKESAGPRGNVWVVGAQNAGKSTLINSFVKKEGVKMARLTEAAVPGTTLGILRVTGILPAKAKMYDTPGLLHPYLMSMRLSREEQKMVEIRKELQPRTYRMKVGQTVHVGGLVRLDLTQASVETIYITVWASPNVSLHMGKTENADEIRMKHIGIRLQPPIEQDRISELGDWEAREIKVSGISWEVNSIDIAVSGLGWFSLGLKGEATVMLWTFDGIEITQREPLVIDKAPFLERPGFWLPKAISDAIGRQSKVEAETKKLKEETTDSILTATI